MPNILTHNYFAKDVEKIIPKYIKESFIQSQNIYETFAYGFDPFFCWEVSFYHEKLGHLGHANYVDTYFLNYIKIMKEEKLTDNDILLASLYGHLTHYVLDSIMHPFIIYKTGKYDKIKPETFKYCGRHTKMEVEIDAYLYHQKTNQEFKNFKIHQLIPKIKFSKSLIKVLNQNYEEVFKVKKGGIKYKRSVYLFRQGVKYLFEDKRGIKKKMYLLMDKLIPHKNLKWSNFSYYITSIDNSIFNNEHKTWYNPWNNKIKSSKSFTDLYEEALIRAKKLFIATYKYLNNKIDIEEYKKVLKNYSYLTGLPWNEKGPIKYLEF